MHFVSMLHVRAMDGVIGFQTLMTKCSQVSYRQSIILRNGLAPLQVQMEMPCHQIPLQGKAPYTHSAGEQQIGQEKADTGGVHGGGCLQSQELSCARNNPHFMNGSQLPSHVV